MWKEKDQLFIVITFNLILEIYEFQIQAILNHWQGNEISRKLPSLTHLHIHILHQYFFYQTFLLQPCIKPLAPMLKPSYYNLASKLEHPC